MDPLGLESSEKTVTKSLNNLQVGVANGRPNSGRPSTAKGAVYMPVDILSEASTSFSPLSNNSPRSPVMRTAAQQKRLERLQGGSLIACNDVTRAGSRPGTPGTPTNTHGQVPLAKTMSDMTGLGTLGLVNREQRAMSGPGAPELGRIMSVAPLSTRTSEAERNLLAKGIAKEFDPTGEIPAGHLGARNRLVTVGKMGMSPISGTEADLKTFLSLPGLKMSPTLCTIERRGPKLFPEYILSLEDGPRFLLAARKKKKATVSEYVISINKDDLSAKSISAIGLLRSNMVGTEFIITDNMKDGVQTSSCLGAVVYETNVLGTRGPRKMTAMIPAVGDGGKRTFKPNQDGETVLQRFKQDPIDPHLVVMHNKFPKWNEQLNAYCLNFNGRVTEASVKNFQLVTREEPDHIILQFGRVSKHQFNMDYQWPMSALQAFAVCLSSFDHKLACE